MKDNMDYRGGNVISYEFLKKYITVFIFVISLIMIFFVIWRWLIPYTLPFVFSYLMRTLLIPLRKRFDGLGINRTMTAVLFTVFIYFGIGGLLCFISRSLLHQLTDLAAKFLESPEEIISPISNAVSRLALKYPEAFEKIDTELIEANLMDKIAEVAGHILEKVAAAAMSVPDVFLFLFAMILSTYYFIKSDGSVIKRVIKLLPKAILGAGYCLRTFFINYAKRYLLSLTVMLIIVFVILTVGLCILRVKYFILLAFVISLIDMLPILGVGTVLVPWGVYSLIVGDVFRGVGLIAVYVLILFTRQLVESRMIGKNIGLSPPLTLMAIYVGYKAFGFTGAIFAPFCAMIITLLIKEIEDGRKEVYPNENSHG